MAREKESMRTLEEILESISNALFPAELGEERITINCKDCDGDTPLHVMAWRKDRYAVKLLIDAGANIDAVGDMNETPLHVAVNQEDIPVIELLLRVGVKTDIRSEFNETAAERAEKKGGQVAKLFRKYAGINQSCKSH